MFWILCLLSLIPFNIVKAQLNPIWVGLTTLLAGTHPPYNRSVPHLITVVYPTQTLKSLPEGPASWFLAWDFFETHKELSNLPITFWAWLFKINFSTFLDIKLDWCVMWSWFFLLTYTYGLRYFEHVPNTNQKSSTWFWKKISVQNLDFCQNIL